MAEEPCATALAAITMEPPIISACGLELIQTDFSSRLNSFVMLCRTLLQESISLHEAASNCSSWICLFDSLNTALSSIIREHESLEVKPDDDFCEDFEPPGSVEPLPKVRQFKVAAFRCKPGSASFGLRIRLRKSSVPKQAVTRRLLNRNLEAKVPKVPIECRYCDATFTSKYTFDAHVRQHEKEFGPAHPNGVVCAICGYRLLKLAYLRAHILAAHRSRKPEIDDRPKLTCDVCAASFRNRRVFGQHMLAHSGDSNFVCDVCGFMTHTQLNLSRHRESHNARAFKCERENCEAAFKTRNSLRKHTVAMHEKPLRHFCEICNAGFTTVHLLKRHRAKHAGLREKTHLCTMCGKTFAERQHLAYHVRNVHKAEFTPMRLAENISEDSGTPRRGRASSKKASEGSRVKAAVVFACQEAGCGSVCASRRELLAHSKTCHAEPFPKQCELCDKVFSTAKNMRMHIRTHSKPHSCHVCGKRMAKLCQKRDHLAKEHNIAFSDAEISHGNARTLASSRPIEVAEASASHVTANSSNHLPSSSVAFVLPGNLPFISPYHRPSDTPQYAPLVRWDEFDYQLLPSEAHFHHEPMM